jgi:hypothetical protein
MLLVVGVLPPSSFPHLLISVMPLVTFYAELMPDRQLLQDAPLESPGPTEDLSSLKAES